MSLSLSLSSSSSCFLTQTRSRRGRKRAVLYCTSRMYNWNGMDDSKEISYQSVCVYSLKGPCSILYLSFLFFFCCCLFRVLRDAKSQEENEGNRENV